MSKHYTGRATVATIIANEKEGIAQRAAIVITWFALLVGLILANHWGG